MYPSRYDRAGARRRQDESIDDESRYGKTASDAYLDRATNFDASESLNTYARGAWGSISDALGHQLSDLKGSAVGAGRFDSGFFDEDSGEVVNRATDQFSNAIARESMNALSAEQRNTESLAGFGSRRSENASDMIGQRYEMEENAAREEAERKRRRRSGIGSAIGGVLGGVGGFLVGGPAGAGAGVKLGSGLGGSL